MACARKAQRGCQDYWNTQFLCLSIKQFTRLHSEKINGINIPLAARIAAIAIFIAKAACKDTADSEIGPILKTLTELSGKRYDPELIQIIHDNNDVVADIINKTSSEI